MNLLQRMSGPDSQLPASGVIECGPARHARSRCCYRTGLFKEADSMAHASGCCTLAHFAASRLVACLALSWHQAIPCPPPTPPAVARRTRCSAPFARQCEFPVHANPSCRQGLALSGALRTAARRPHAAAAGHAVVRVRHRLPRVRAGERAGGGGEGKGRGRGGGGRQEGVRDGGSGMGTAGEGFAVVCA